MEATKKQDLRHKNQDKKTIEVSSTPTADSGLKTLN
jgi:hypothetical protein